jgi:diguanylate cyclase (GGDEF)-like protein
MYCLTPLDDGPLQPPCFRSDVTAPVSDPVQREDAHQRRIRRTWLFLAGTFFVLGLLIAIRMGVGGARPVDLLLLGLVAIVGYAAILHRDAVHGLELERRAEAETFGRIVQGLSRSMSPEAIVDAIVEGLSAGTGADHIVVVRRRPGRSALEAKLVSSRPGVASSTTLFPLADLEDPVRLRRPIRRRVAIPVGQAELALEPARGGSGGSSGVTRALRGGATLALDWLSDLRPGQANAALEADAGLPVGRRVLGEGSTARIAEQLAERVRSVYGLQHTLAAPLTGSDGVVGSIVLSRRTAGPWPRSAARILGSAAIEASAALARAASHREAETLASTDALTGLPNRRYFDEFCGLLARRRRAGDAMGVLMIDIDRFKALNDTYGHGVGDRVLRAVGQAIARAVREEDVPARYGGEEFAVLLRSPTPGVAVEVAERVRASVAAIDLRELGIEGVSVSVGVAVARRRDHPIGDILADADRALYDAKRGGRDRVVAA